MFFIFTWSLDLAESRCSNHKILRGLRTSSSEGWKNENGYFLRICLMFIFIWKTERNKVWWGTGRERDRQTQNPNQAPGSKLSAQSSTQGSNSQTVRSWLELNSDAQLTEPPRCPENGYFLKCHLYQQFFMFWGSFCLSSNSKKGERQERNETVVYFDGWLVGMEEPHFSIVANWKGSFWCLCMLYC